jgi:hypothetical protein
MRKWWEFSLKQNILKDEKVEEEEEDVCIAIFFHD